MMQRTREILMSYKQRTNWLTFPNALCIHHQRPQVENR